MLRGNEIGGGLFLFCRRCQQQDHSAKILPSGHPPCVHTPLDESWSGVLDGDTYLIFDWRDDSRLRSGLRR